MADWSKLQNIWQDPWFQAGVGMLSANRGPSGGEAFQNALRGGMQGMLRGQTITGNIERQKAATHLAQQQQQQRAMQLEQQRRLAAAAPQLAPALLSQDPQVQRQAAAGIAGMVPEALPGMIGGALAQPSQQKPTTLMQNLAATGLVPGTPEYQKAMSDILAKPIPPQSEGPKFTDISSLRKEYSQLSKPWVGIRDAYEKLEASKDSAAGDISLIFSYMKILDPTSTVREGEAATVEQARGVPGTILNLYNRLVKGERLQPEQRADFKGQGRSLVEQQLAHQLAREQTFTEISERAGMNPEDIVRDLIGKYRRESGGGGIIAKPQTQAEYDALPPGALFIDPDDGEEYRKP